MKPVTKTVHTVLDFITLCIQKCKDMVAIDTAARLQCSSAGRST